MKRFDFLMAAVGSILVLAVLTPHLFADDPNYPGYNPDLTWEEGGGQGTPVAGTVCTQQIPCLTANYCYTPYNATFNATQYQSFKVTTTLAYGLCMTPLLGGPPGPDCTRFATVPCAVVDLWTLQNCAGVPLTKFVYRKNACNV